jgi:hypothetical protein
MPTGRNVLKWAVLAPSIALAVAGALWLLAGEPPPPPSPAAGPPDPRLAAVIEERVDLALAFAMQDFAAEFPAFYLEQLGEHGRREAEARHGPGYPDLALKAAAPEVRGFLRARLESVFGSLARRGDTHGSLEARLITQQDAVRRALAVEAGMDAGRWRAMARGLDKAGLPVPPEVREQARE